MTPTKPTVLFLTDSYLHHPSINGVCCENVVHEGQKRGYSITVLADFLRNDDLLREEMNGVTVLRIKPSGLIRLVTRLKQKKGILAALLRKSLTLTHRIGNEMAWRFMSFFLRHEIEWYQSSAWSGVDFLFIMRLYRTLDRLYQKQHFDYLIVSHYPPDNLAAAAWLKKKYPQICYIPWMLDALAGGNWPHVKSSESGDFDVDYYDALCLKRERYFFKNADRIFAMETSRNYHNNHCREADYYDRFRYMEPSLFTLPRSPKNGTLPVVFDRSKINILFAGYLYELRDPTSFFQTLDQHLFDNVVCWLCGGITAQNLKIVNFYEEKYPGHIHVLGNIPHEQLGALYQQADFLLNVGEKNPNVIAGKIFEYMATGKPILSTVPDGGNTATAYLQRYPAALLLPESEDVEKAAVRLEIFFNQWRGKNLCFEEYADSFYESSPKAFWDALSK